MGGGCLGRAREAVPIPAQQMQPERGEVVEVVHWRVRWRALVREGVEETSVGVKRVRWGLVRRGMREGVVGVEA